MEKSDYKTGSGNIRTRKKKRAKIKNSFYI